jgi:hypothetical protein
LAFSADKTMKSWILSLTAALFFLPQEGRSAPAPALIPATMQPHTDSMGFIWDLDQNGAIQNGSNLFSSAMYLEVNNSSISPQQVMMTPDGTEYFLDSNQNNVMVTRRIKIDQKSAFTRYFDTFRNGSGTALSLRINYRVQFNNQMQGAVTDTGAPLGTTLSVKETGFLVMRQPNQPGPCAMFLCAGRNAKMRPILSNQQSYRYNIGYTLQLAAGETVSLAHAVAQRSLPTTPDAKALGKLFNVLNSPRLLADVPPKERKTLANFSPGGFSSGPTAPSLVSELEKLQVERGPSDVLAIGTETRLKGTASCTRIEIETARGKVVIPFENIAAILGGRRETRVLLRDGQVVSGKLSAEGLKFALTSGTTISLNAATLDRLVLRAESEDTAAAAATWGYVETFAGERLAVKPDPGFKLRATTAWGLREVALDEIVGCGPTEENPLGVRMLLKDGSYFHAFLDGDSIKLDTVLFGPQSFATTEIRQIAVVLPKPAAETTESAPERAQVVAVGGQILSGQIDLAELHFLSPAGVIPLAANLIRTLHNTSEDATANAPVFTATVWGGGTVSGRLREVVVPVRTASTVFQVPVRDLVDVTVPTPAMPEALRDKIAAYLRDLGHADWEKREAASRGLGELGGISRTALMETVKQTTDAEVRRRAQALLDSIETL